MAIKLAKFGGSSLADAQAFRPGHALFQQLPAGDGLGKAIVVFDPVGPGQSPAAVVSPLT